MANVLIREVCSDELAVFAKVIRQSFATVAADFGLTMQNCPTNGAFMQTERLLSDHSRGDVMAGLFADGQPSGFAQLAQKSEDVFELCKLAVLPPLRHAGHGTQLLEWACDTVRKKGGNKITIGIIEENTMLKDWYLLHGFVHTGTRLFAHLPFTVGFMELSL